MKAYGRKFYKRSLRLMLIFITCSCLNINDSYGKEKIPLIVITDLYHPHQDPGDNFELINAYAMPEFDLKAVILDCYHPFRNKIAKNVSKGLWEDPNGPREPGMICVQQLNYIFGREIPCGVGPFEQMQQKNDRMDDLSDFFNQGINLLKTTLEQSEKRVTIASFGSSRVLAVAFNRFPALMKRKIEMIHLSAGTGGNDPEYLEWNVALDTLAFVSLMESGLPITLYPCAAATKGVAEGGLSNAFKGAKDNTYYQLDDLSFVEKMHPKLRQYVHFVFTRSTDADFLGYLDRVDLPGSVALPQYQHVWETALWMNIAGRRLVQNPQGEVTIKSENEIETTDLVFGEGVLKCDIRVLPSGIFSYRENIKGLFYIYHRDNPARYQELMNQALPVFYTSFLR